MNTLDIEPQHVLIDGRLCYRWPDGRTFPVIRGGADDGGKPDDPPGDKNEFKPPATQAEFDRIIEERLNRDRKGRPTADELTELRDKANKFDAAELAGKTELEQERALREAAEKGAVEALAKAKQFKLEAAIVAAAGKSADPDLVTQVILADPDKYAVTIDDAGQVTGAETAVAALLEAKPYLAGKQPDPEMGQGRGDADKPTGLAAGMARAQARRDARTTQTTNN